jgi:HEAT repeat protein
VLAAAEPLKQLLAASDPRDRAAAAEALGNIGVRGFYRPLLAFLRDPDPYVRRRAIAAAGKLRTPELIPSLIEQFHKREVVLEAAAALAAFGPGIEHEVTEKLCDDKAPPALRRGCALVLQRLGTREAADGLIDGLGASDPSVRKAAARALSRVTRRQAELGIDVARVQGAVRVELQGARIALGILKKLSLPSVAQSQEPRTPAELLSVALLEERDACVLQSLVLLEVLLPQVRLDVVAENLVSDSPAQRGNAIELIDNALPDPWKGMVMAALGETKRRIDTVLPDPRPVSELLSALITGEAGTWVGAVAARWSLDSSVPLQPLLPVLRAALSSPAAPLREAAALALARTAPAEAPHLLQALAEDSAASVSRTVRALLLPRAFA